MTCFDSLCFSDPVRRAITSAGYKTPTPIQRDAIPHLLEGHDLLGCAQTGTGKTAAFILPILHHLSIKPRTDKRRSPLALVLTPTRELADQIVDSVRTYGRYMSIRTMAVYGGVPRKRQAQRVHAGVDVLVATPGRLLDLMSTNQVSLRDLRHFVLDEADRMLDMGFIHDMKKIIAELPKERQSLFFSATMPRTVEQLANQLLRNPVTVTVERQATPVKKIQQSVLFVDQARKNALLQRILEDPTCERVLIFTRTKRRADRLAQQLERQSISADAIHGNKSQPARTRSLQKFKRGATRVLVATDVAARGIDIDGITHVINYELPNEPESYVHRIGRTARAGKDGQAISFCAGDERGYLKSIERVTRLSIDVDRAHECHSDEAERGMVNGQPGAVVKKAQARKDNRPRHGQGQNGSRGGASQGRSRNAQGGQGRSARPQRAKRAAHR